MIVFAMRTGFPFLLSWYKRKGNEKKKSRLRLRAYSGKVVLALKNELASVSLRSNSIFQHRPSIPPLTPLRLGQSFFTPRRFAVGFLFWLCLAFGFCFFSLLFWVLTYLFIYLSVIGVIESLGNGFSSFTCIYSLIIGLGVPFGGGRRFTCELWKKECDSQKKRMWCFKWKNTNGWFKHRILFSVFMRWKPCWIIISLCYTM